MSKNKGRFVDYSSYGSSGKTKQLAQNIIKSINSNFNKISRAVKIMHVCGTHEATVARSGMRTLLPKDLRIIAGPGCPVCVCPSEHVTAAIQLAEDGNTVVTFGDMFKVPDAGLTTLSQAKAKGNDIRVVYSVMDAVELARSNPDQKIVWLGIGFETTAPMTSFMMEKNPPENFYVLSDFRLVPPAMELLTNSPEFDLDGYVLPGHVTTIMGTNEYNQFPEKYNVPCVVGGFDPIDFLLAMDKMLMQIVDGEAFVENAYPRVVTKEGNLKAKQSMNNVFDKVDAKWRGVGIIGSSGLELKPEFADHNARYLLKDPIEETNDLPKGCKCGSVILGRTEPEECPHFLRRCTPETAIGPCMVSDEGTCRIRATYKSLEM